MKTKETELAPDEDITETDNVESSVSDDVSITSFI